MSLRQHIIPIEVTDICGKIITFALQERDRPAKRLKITT